MAAGTPFPFIPLKQKLLSKKIDYTADTIKVALFTSALVLSSGYLGASGDARYADVSANEVPNGSGYTTGGVTPGGQALAYYVQSATIAAAGGGGTNGAQTVTGTTGTGTKFQAAVTIAGNIITSVNSISTVGSYTVLPTDPTQEPVTGAGLAGAKLNIAMGAFFDLNDATWAGSSFTAKWAIAYDNTTANKDLLFGWDLETTLAGGLTTISGTMSAVFNAAQGLFTLF